MLLTIGVIATGCDTFTFNPPRPAELATKPSTSSAASTTATPSSSRTIAVVLAPRIAADAEALTTAARLQAGIDKVRIQVSAPPEGAAASAQAELVRAAVAGKPPVIVIEAPTEPAAELIEAVAEARKTGVAVVCIGRPIGADPSASSTSGAPLVVVESEPLKKSASILVADAMRSAKNGGIAADSGAVILFDPTVDALYQGRIDALREALESAGVKKIETLKFERTIKDGEEKLVAFLNAHPETTLVFATDAGGVLAADDATGVLKTKHRYAIAGYSGNEAVRNQVLMGEYSAIGVDAFDKLLRHAVNAATGIFKKKDVPSRLPLEIVVHESDVKAGLPRMKVAPPEKPSIMSKMAKPPKTD